MLAMNERFYSWLMTIPFSCLVCATVRSKPKPTAKKCGHVPLNAFSTASVVTMPLFTESIVDALRKSAFHHAELRTCLSMRVWRMAWATSKVVTKLCLEQELEQSTKIERIHQDLHEIKVYSSRGLRFIWPLHCKKTRKPTPNWPLPWQSIRCYMPRSQFLCHLSCLLEIDWSTLTLILA